MRVGDLCFILDHKYKSLKTFLVFNKKNPLFEIVQVNLDETIIVRSLCDRAYDPSKFISIACSEYRYPRDGKHLCLDFTAIRIVKLYGVCPKDYEVAMFEKKLLGTTLCIR